MGGPQLNWLSKYGQIWTAGVKKYVAFWTVSFEKVVDSKNILCSDLLWKNSIENSEQRIIYFEFIYFLRDFIIKNKNNINNLISHFL